MTQPDTRTRILDASERLFAEQGFAGTSLRAITTEAGTNLASVNYHFGSKDALIAEVFRRRAEPINRQRLALLEDSLARDPQDVAGILGAFLKPALRMGDLDPETKGRVMRLVGRVHFDSHDDLHRIFVGIFAEVKDRFQDALARALPTLDRTELTLRFHFVMGTMAHVMMHRSWMIAHDPNLAPLPPDQLVPSITGFLVGGLKAPPALVSPETL